MNDPGRWLRRAVAPLMLAAAVAARAQVPSPAAARIDLLRELAARVAAAAGTTDPIRLSVSIAGTARDLLSVPKPIDAELAPLLRARGMRLAPAGIDAASAERMPHVRVTCGDSVSDVVCTAEVARPDAPAAAIVVSRPRSAFDRPDRSTPLVAIELRPLYAQRRPMLDVVPLDERRLLLLDTNGLMLVEAGEDGWREVATRPLSGVTWPRDPRGRITVGDGRVFEAFVPGLHCRGVLEPFELSCAEGRDPWPLLLENGGLAEGRNFFTSPRTAPFFSAAAPNAAGAAWALAGVDGKLRLLDDAFRETGTFGGHGDEVVALRIGCGLSRRLLVTTPADSEDTLGAYEIDVRRVQPRSAAALPGPLTALWQVDEERAVAVAHNIGLERYEAFVVRLACVR